MTQNEKLALMKDRYNKKAQMPKNLKCPGAMKKLRRHILKMEQ